MSGRNLLQAAYHANLAAQEKKNACREPEGGVNQIGEDDFNRQVSLMKEQARQLIRKVPDPAQQKVLEKRYLESLTFEEIAAEIPFSVLILLGIAAQKNENAGSDPDSSEGDRR